MFMRERCSSKGDSNKWSDLEKYLSDECKDSTADFDILYWWKCNEKKYLVLSLLACDVLVIPISIVASESAFSTGGHVLDAFRSSLSPKIMESLICAQDWLRAPTQVLCVEEHMDPVDDLEQGIYLCLLFIDYFIFNQISLAIILILLLLLLQNLEKLA